MALIFSDDGELTGELIVDNWYYSWTNRLIFMNCWYCSSLLLVHLSLNMIDHFN